MACFIVPAAEAIVTTIAAKVIEKKELNSEAAAQTNEETSVSTVRITFSRKLKWLRNLLWGGTVLLAFEHVWHGEVVPWFPFLTAARDPVDTAEMLLEMGTVGVAMAVLITAVWVGMVVVASVIERRALPDEGGRESA